MLKAKVGLSLHKQGSHQSKQGNMSKARQKAPAKKAPAAARGRRKLESACEKENVDPALQKSAVMPTKTKLKAADNSQSRNKPPYSLSQLPGHDSDSPAASLINGKTPKKRKKTVVRDEPAKRAMNSISDHEEGQHRALS